MTGSHDDDSDRDNAEDAAQPRRDEEMDAAEVEERFAALIANFDSESPEAPADSSQSDTQDRLSQDDSDTDDGDEGVRTPNDRDEGPPTVLEILDSEIPDDPEEDNYEPPPPPPLPVPSLPAVLGVLLIFGGVLLMIWPAALDVGTNLGLMTGIGAFVGGVLMLIWRLRSEPDDDEPDNDNGAVVLRSLSVQSGLLSSQSRMASKTACQPLPVMKSCPMPGNSNGAPS